MLGPKSQEYEIWRTAGRSGDKFERAGLSLVMLFHTLALKRGDTRYKYIFKCF